MRLSLLKELMEEEGNNASETTGSVEANGSPQDSTEVELDAVTGEPAQAALQKMRIFVGSIKQLAQTINIKHDVIKNAMTDDNDFRALVNSDNQNTEEQLQNEETGQQDDTSSEPNKELEKAKSKAKAYLKDYNSKKGGIDKAITSLKTIDDELKSAKPEELNINEIAFFLKNLRNRTELDKIKDKQIYNGGPKFEPLVTTYVGLKNFYAKQEKLIEAIKDFIDTGEKSDIDVGDVTTRSDAALNAKVASLKNNSILKAADLSDDANIENLIKLVDMIAPKKTNESLNEGLYDTLKDFFSRGKQYSLAPNGDKKVETAKDLKNYVEFIVKQTPPPQPEPEVQAPEPEQSEQQESILRENITEQAKTFFNQTEFSIDPKIYSKRFIQDIMRIANLVDNTENQSFTKLKNIATFIDKSGNNNKFKYEVLFNEETAGLLTADLVNKVTPEVIKAIIDYTPETTSESLLRDLIKEQIRSLHGKKMVRN